MSQTLDFNTPMILLIFPYELKWLLGFIQFDSRADKKLLINKPSKKQARYVHRRGVIASKFHKLHETVLLYILNHLTIQPSPPPIKLILDNP